MPEIPDFNVPGFGKPLSQVRQDTWDKLQDPKYQKQLVLITVSIGNFFFKLYIFLSKPVITGILQASEEPLRVFMIE